MKPKIIHTWNLDKSTVDPKTKLFIDFFEKQMGCKFVDVTPKLKIKKNK